MAKKIFIKKNYPIKMRGKKYMNDMCDCSDLITSIMISFQLSPIMQMKITRTALAKESKFILGVETSKS